MPQFYPVMRMPRTRLRADIFLAHGFDVSHERELVSRQQPINALAQHFLFWVLYVDLKRDITGASKCREQLRVTLTALTELEFVRSRSWRNALIQASNATLFRRLYTLGIVARYLCDIGVARRLS